MTVPRRRCLFSAGMWLLMTSQAGAQTGDIEAKYNAVHRHYEELKRAGADLSELAPLISEIQQVARARDAARLAPLLDRMEAALNRISAPAGPLPPPPPAECMAQPHGASGGGEYPIIAEIRSSPAYLDLIRRRAPAVAPDGAVGRNQHGFSDVAAQRDVIWLALRGLATNSAADIDATIRALEYGFRQQQPAGNFANGRGASARKCRRSRKRTHFCSWKLTH